MTDAELKNWAEAILAGVGNWSPWVTREAAKKVFSLLADQEGRGEVQPACPECGSFEFGGASAIGEGISQCHMCDAVFGKPAYYQCVPAPKSPMEGQS